METKDTTQEGTQKTCKKCGKTLPIEDFGRNRYGITSVCKTCEHENRSKGAKSRKKTALAKYSKEELLAELESRGYSIMASPTPRELILRLKKLGYDGEITFTEVKRINIGTFE